MTVGDASGTDTVVVVDASALVALLVDAGDAGSWVAAVCEGRAFAGPELLGFEVVNVLRRHELAGLIDRTAAGLAHDDLVDLALQAWPYTALAARVWQLRSNLTAYDASYVAVAEILDAPLVTLDKGVSRAPGLRCQVLAYTPTDADPGGRSAQW